MFGNFRPATLNEYIKWLKGYMKHGGVPTHYYDYPFSQSNQFLYVTGNFGLGEIGASARHIIVDHRAKLDPRKSLLGHHVLFYMKGYKSRDKNGSPALHVPIFNDDEFLRIPRIDPHIERLATKQSTDREVKVNVADRDNPLSSANDCWTGHPSTDRAMLVSRAKEAHLRNL